jgi:hypothetical protein
MYRDKYSFIGGVLVTSFLLILFPVSTAAQAQQKAAPSQRAYDPAREVALRGTVQSYTAASEKPPFGAHVMVQTSSGAVDVQVGSDKFLQFHHFSLAAGDSVQIIGESVPYGEGTIFLARVIQKDGQSLAVRSAMGMPLLLGGGGNGRATGQAAQQGGAR